MSTVGDGWRADLGADARAAGSPARSLRRTGAVFGGTAGSGAGRRRNLRKHGRRRFRSSRVPSDGRERSATARDRRRRRDHRDGDVQRPPARQPDPTAASGRALGEARDRATRRRGARSARPRAPPSRRRRSDSFRSGARWTASNSFPPAPAVRSRRAPADSRGRVERVHLPSSSCASETASSSARRPSAAMRARSASLPRRIRLRTVLPGAPTAAATSSIE